MKTTAILKCAVVAALAAAAGCASTKARETRLREQTNNLMGF